MQVFFDKNIKCMLESTVKWVADRLWHNAWTVICNWFSIVTQATQTFYRNEFSERLNDHRLFVPRARTVRHSTVGARLHVQPPHQLRVLVRSQAIAVDLHLEAVVSTTQKLTIVWKQLWCCTIFFSPTARSSARWWVNACVRKMDTWLIYFGFWCLMINKIKLD